MTNVVHLVTIVITGFISGYSITDKCYAHKSQVGFQSVISGTNIIQTLTVLDELLPTPVGGLRKYWTGLYNAKSNLLFKSEHTGAHCLAEGIVQQPLLTRGAIDNVRCPNNLNVGNY